VAGFDAVGECDACDYFRQLVLPIEAAPGALGGEDELEHHDHAGLVGEAALGARRAVTDGCEGALDRVAGADVLPMLGGEVVERQRRFPVLGKTGGCLVVFGLILGPKPVKAFSASLRPCAIQISLRSALALGCTDLGSLFRTFMVLWTRQRCCRVATNTSSSRPASKALRWGLADSRQLLDPRPLEGRAHHGSSATDILCGIGPDQIIPANRAP
jgi:hypothetical protein